MSVSCHLFYETEQYFTFFCILLTNKAFHKLFRRVHVVKILGRRACIINSSFYKINSKRFACYMTLHWLNNIDKLFLIYKIYIPKIKCFSFFQTHQKEFNPKLSFLAQGLTQRISMFINYSLSRWNFCSLLVIIFPKFHQILYPVIN